MIPALSDALDQARRLYAEPMRAAAAARAAGRKIVGLVGPTVPIELVMAAGCFPVTLTGRSGATPIGDRFMEPIFEPELREVFDRLLNGSYGQLDLLIIPRSSDQYNKLYLYLREADRLGHGDRLPRLELYDMLHTQTPLSRRYGLERTRELATVLAQVGGNAVDHDSVAKALLETNRLRSALRDLQARRDAGTLGLAPADTLRLLGIRRFDEPSAVAPLIETITAGLPHMAARSVPRILVKGFPLHHTRLHELITAAGGEIVAEDDWWGARAAERAVAPGDDAVAAVFEAVFSEGHSVRTEPRAVRNRWFDARIASTRVDGVIFYIPPFDDVSGWDYPGERDTVRRAGLAELRIDEDVEAPEHAAAIRAQVTRFVAQMQDARLD